MSAAPPDHDQLVATMTGGMVRPELAPSFAGSARLRPDGRPRPEFRAGLRRIPDLANAVAVAATMAAPVAIVWLAITFDHPVAWALAFVAMGSTLNRLFILHHEAAHRLLFSNRRFNDVVGINLIGWLPFGTGSHGYRRGHVNHHRDEFGPREPDFLLYSFYPISRPSLRRKLTRDAFGVSAWRIVKPRFSGLFDGRHLALSLRFFAGQAVVFGLFVLVGHPWLYLFLWLLPYLTLYQVYNRLRAIAEHAGMTRSGDRRNTTHHVRQSWLARLVFVPCNVGYHLAHHVDSGIPYRNLPALHAALVEDGYLPAAGIWPSYRALWKGLVRS
jgi:fatty acid desaturase